MSLSLHQLWDAIASFLGDNHNGLILSYVSLATMALIPVYAGSKASIKFPKKKKPGRKGRIHDDDAPEYFSFDDAKWYPLVGSVTLVSLYLVIKFVSKDIINMILTTNFLMLGIGAFYKSMLMASRYFSGLELIGDYSLVLSNKDEEIFGANFGYFHLVLATLCAAMGVAYGFTKNWVLSNLYGEALSIVAIQLLQLDSFWTGIMLLSGLFFYDIFWVFGTEVMVTVAKGLDVPIKVVWPRNLTAVIEQGIISKPTGVQFSMLGLGDIVIPGIFVALCLNFDHHRYLQTSAGKKNKHSRVFPTPYFNVCFIFYILGLVATVLVMHTFQTAQPALLYLSPACILAALGTAAVRGEVKELFAFAPNGGQAAAAAAASAKDKEKAHSTSAPNTPSPKRKSTKPLASSDSNEASVDSQSEAATPASPAKRRSKKST